ncbi:MAG: restriction endonuclease subunit S [Lachnospiraceae bacterium]|nr:restriction endonuclease subunit S [Lachnospiraceae bacterium]
MSYPTEKLGKYIDILSGFAFKSKDFSNTGVPVIKIKNITPPYVSLEDVTYVPNDIATQQKKFQVHYGDILIALTGSHINQMASVVGRIAKVNFFDKALLNQRVGKIYIVDDTSCNLDYVYYFLSQEKVKIELASKAGGAANQANISPTDVKNLQIPFPSKAIQDRIADILLAYDNLIENNQKQIKLLEEAARRLYKEWFVDLRFPGYETTPVVDGVPEGWAKVEVGDCIAKVARTKQVMTAELLEVGKIPVVDQSRNFIAGYTNDEETIVDFGIPIIVFGDHTRVLKYYFRS